MQSLTKIQFSWKLFFKILTYFLPLGVMWILIKKFYWNSSINWSEFGYFFHKIPSYFFIIIILFSLINWSFEALKWKILISNIQEFSFKQSFFSVLSGIPVSQLLPYKTGEYLGRLYFIKNEHRKNAVLLSIFGGYSQLLVTLLIGIPSLFVLPILFEINFFFVLSIVIVISLLFFYFFFEKLFKIKHLLIFSSLEKVLNVKIKLKILILSFLRYISFLIPYIILCNFFKLPENGDFIIVVSSVAVIFLFQTAFPSFILTDVVVRASVPIFVFCSIYKLNPKGTEFLPGMIVYIFNTLIPMLIGLLVFLIRKKIKKRLI